jgi:hypothetical protein
MLAKLISKIYLFFFFGLVESDGQDSWALIFVWLGRHEPKYFVNYEKS